MPGIGVIYNPRSGRNLRDPQGGASPQRGARRPRRRPRGRLDRRALPGRRGLPKPRHRRPRHQRRRRHERRHHHRLPRRLPAARAPPDRLPARRHDEHGGQLGRRTARASRRVCSTGSSRPTSSGPRSRCQDVERHVLKLRGDDLRAALADARTADAAPASMRSPPLAEKHGFVFGTGVVCGYLAEYYAGGKGSPTPSSPPRRSSAASAARSSAAR